MSEPQQDDPWKALRRTNTVYGDYYDADRADDAKAHMEARHAEELATLRARADEYEARVKQDHDEIVELTAEIMTLRAQLAAGRQEIEAALKQLMADAFAAKLTATDAADVAYVAGLQKGIDLLAALASPSTPEPHVSWRDANEPTQHWGVDVRRNGENLVTIESNCLCGKPEFSEVEAEVIRQCADHLQAFIGPRSTPEPQTCEAKRVPCYRCGADATREFCYAAEPWCPYCPAHPPQYETVGDRPLALSPDQPTEAQ